MGTILASAITLKASIILHDQAGSGTTSGTKWVLATELFGYVNSAQRAICRLVPSAYVLSASTILIAGCKQAVAAGTTQIIDIPRNMGVSPGSTPGRAITRVRKADMDRANPNWMTDTAAATVLNWMYDLASPLIFYVYPPQPSSGFGYVEIERAAAPADIATHGTAITLGDEWEQAILDAVLHYSYLKDSGHTPNAVMRADQHLKSFMSLLGITDKAQAQTALKQAAE
jgi:hypothetical protein